MFSINSSQVTITNPNIVKYFNEHQNDPAFLNSCSKLFESFCTLDTNSKFDNLVENSVSTVTNSILSKLSDKFNNFNPCDTPNDTLFNLLTQYISKTGYFVTKVNDIKNGSNLVIQNKDYFDINIQSYTHTKDSVSKSEIDSYENYLVNLNTNGIFVSVFTKINGKNSIEFCQLPNNKFVIYLSNNYYDCDVILNLIRLLTTLDYTSSKHTLTNVDILRIKGIIANFDCTTKNVKHHIKSVISTCNTITYDYIKQIITQSTNDSSSVQIACDVCGFLPKNHTGLVAHKRKCNRLKTIDTK